MGASDSGREGGSRGPGIPEPPPSVLSFLEHKTGDAPRVSLRPEESAEAGDPVLDASTPARKALPRGSGKYQLLGEVARGGMGVVLRGHDTDLGRDVAVKVLHEGLASDENVLQRFVEEAQIGGQLQHPGIVPVYDLGLMEDERPYFTMKLVKGKTLSALFAARVTPEEDRGHLLDVFLSVCQTVAYAHSRGVIHRDLKPSNVMVGAFGEVQVVDWGLAKVLSRGGTADEKRARERSAERTVLETVRSGGPGSGSSHSVVGSVMGTPAYMPPEQATGNVEKLDERSDVFSLGAILCELLTGEPPYPGDFSDAVLKAANADLEDADRRLDACIGEPELVELARQCLRPAQLARPASAEVLADRVREYIRSKEERVRQAEIEAAVQRRAKWIWTGVVAVIVLLLGSGVVYRERATAARRERALSIQRDAREARLQAESLVARARESKNLELWHAARAEAARARTIAETEGLASLPELDQLIQNIEEERAEFLAARDRDRRRESFQRRLAALSFAPLDIMGVDARLPEILAAYRATFQELGVDVVTASADEVERTLREAHLLEGDADTDAVGAALESWIRVAMSSRSGLGATDHLIDIADRVDPDPFRRRLRALVRSNDPGELARLVDSPEVDEASPSSLLMLVKLLVRGGNPERSGALILSGRERHPGDLGLTLVAGLIMIYGGEDYWRALPYFVAGEAIKPGAPSPRFFRA
ncbi:MAG TPA: serine/threonine protein kinase, partial [Planctomycetes bacterium]|nr:serine/threonine protein kinase [Planctomycetota bacterium]